METKEGGVVNDALVHERRRALETGLAVAVEPAVETPETLVVLQLQRVLDREAQRIVEQLVVAQELNDVFADPAEADVVRANVQVEALRGAAIVALAVDGAGGDREARETPREAREQPRKPWATPGSTGRPLGVI